MNRELFDFLTGDFETPEIALDYCRNIFMYERNSRLTLKEVLESEVKAKTDFMKVYEGDDQPPTCPECGSRTNNIFEFEGKSVISDDGEVLKQVHICLSCKNDFVLECEKN